MAVALAPMALATLGSAGAATLSEKAREMECTSKPISVAGTPTYKCQTRSGTFSYFNVPGVEAEPPRSGEPARKSATSSAAAATPSSFPRVDTATQKSRDDMRRRVLSDELTAEEKLLADARAAYHDGAPPPMPEEKSDAEKYRERIARLRQAVNIHEKNIEALRKEIAALK